MELGGWVNRLFETTFAHRLRLNWIQQHDALCTRRPEDLLMDEAGIAVMAHMPDLQSFSLPKLRVPNISR